MTETVDDLDRAIIGELERDGRTPFREIGRALDVSEATIRARYRRLVDSGLLRIVAFSDPNAHSKSRLALLFLKVTPDRHDAVVKLLGEHEEVSYVSTVLGPWDVFAQVLVADDAALWAFLQTVVRPMDGVLETDCTLEMKVHKLWFDASPTV
jgi:Lrp/AsnC family transcriptional regulator, regulator for asnA, asnC and gidA